MHRKDEQTLIIQVDLSFGAEEGVGKTSSSKVAMKVVVKMKMAVGMMTEEMTAVVAVDTDTTVGVTAVEFAVPCQKCHEVACIGFAEPSTDRPLSGEEEGALKVTT